MTVKENLHTYTHKGYNTTDTKIIILEIPFDNSGRISKHKFKFTYECYNSGESFTGDLFDGVQLNHIFSITDLGFVKDIKAYVMLDEPEIKQRIEMLTLKGIEFIKTLF